MQSSGRKVRLTGDGEILFDHARRILGVYREAMTAFDRTPLEGEITVGLPDDYVISLMIPGNGNSQAVRSACVSPGRRADVRRDQRVLEDCSSTRE